MSYKDGYFYPYGNKDVIAHQITWYPDKKDAAWHDTIRGRISTQFYESFGKYPNKSDTEHYLNLWLERKYESIIDMIRLDKLHSNEFNLVKLKGKHIWIGDTIDG